MKRILLIFFAAALLFAGCAPEVADTPPAYTAPTLPEFDQGQSPLEKLTAAVEKLKTADSFRMEFGQGEDVTELTITADTEDSLLDDAKALVPNPQFLQDFCDKKIIVSPSNTGTFTFYLNGIDAEVFTAVTGIPTAAESCGISMTIDADGYFSQLELTEDETVTFLHIYMD